MKNQQLQMIWYQEILKKKRMIPSLDCDLERMLDVVMVFLVHLFMCTTLKVLYDHAMIDLIVLLWMIGL